MGRKKGSGKSKSEKAESKEAALLGDEFLNTLNSADEEKLREMASEVTADRVKFTRVRDADMDLKAAKMAAATASAPYREGFKRLDIKSKWITARLEGMGLDVGSGDYDMDAGETKLTDEQVNELGGPKVGPITVTVTAHKPIGSSEMEPIPSPWGSKA